MEDNKKKIGHNEVIGSNEEEIIKGARNTDQLDKLQPDNDEEKNNNKHQAGTPPNTDVNNGEQ